VVEDESAAVPVEVEAGGVIFFSYGVAHRTGANQTDRERAGLAFHFLHADHIRGDKNKSDFIRLRGDGATAGVSEYDVDLSNAWAELVNNAVTGGA
jgi:ectoine hydroxylase-related dioxygenase (phytanoyl-CoA dioxygenase family)